MLDEALGPDDMSSFLTDPPPQEVAVRDKVLSTPDPSELRYDRYDEDDDASPLDASDALEDELGRGSSPDMKVGAEPHSAPRPRVTLRIPDDDIPMSSPPPQVEETKPDKLVGPAAVVQVMRIIAVGEAAPPSREEPFEVLAPEDQLDGEPLGTHDVQSTWTPPVVRAEAVEDASAGHVDDLEFGSRPSREPEELEPEAAEEEPANTLPPVTVVDRPAARAESPSPPITAPLSPSASAPPPPSKGAARAGSAVVPPPQGAFRVELSPVPLPQATPSPAQAVVPVVPGPEPSVLELSDEEIAPASTEKPRPIEDDGDLEEPPVTPRVTALAEEPAPTPKPALVPPPPMELVAPTQPAVPAPSHDQPPPTPVRPPKAPPPPKARPQQEFEKRSRKGRPGWEEVFADEFVRAYPRLTSGQVNSEVTFIEKSLGIQRGGVVLDLGCGTGQHAVELASRGYNVVGYDLSLTMLAMAADEAQERGQKINFLQGDMREMAFEEMFDGIFSWATSFGFFDEEKNVSVVQRVHRALRKGGMFLLDLINRDYICARLPSLAWFEGDGCVCIDDAQFNSITSRLRVKRTIMIEDGTSREAEYTVRLYSLHEIGKILHDTGFKVVEVSGHPATSGAFFDADSPRVITLAVRR
jgi:SAM-dependent methyltransferase